VSFTEAGSSARDQAEAMSVARELHSLEQTAEAGATDESIVIIGVSVWVVVLVAFLALLAISLLAYRLAS
jgi:hypothetical protein